MQLPGWAQERFIVTPNRGGAEGARQTIQLQQETNRGIAQQVSITAIQGNVSNLQGRMGTAETNLGTLQTNVNGLTTRMGTAETNIGTLQGQMANVRPHSTAVMPGNCSQSGAKLRWNTTSNNWECVAEGDPTVRDFAKNDLPACGTNQVLRSNGIGFTCVTGGSGGVTVELDPKVGATTINQFCRGTGSQVTCDQPVPNLSETDPQVGAVTNNLWCRGDGASVQCDQNPPALNETDPKIGPITNGKWCTGTGSSISCTSDAPYNPIIVESGTFLVPDICVGGPKTDYENAFFCAGGAPAKEISFTQSFGSPPHVIVSPNLAADSNLLPCTQGAIDQVGSFYDNVTVNGFRAYAWMSPASGTCGVWSNYVGPVKFSWLAVGTAPAQTSAPSAPGCSKLGQAAGGGNCATTGPNALVVTAIETESDLPPRLAWGSSGIFRGVTSLTDGATNTATLASFGASAHPAAHYCANLVKGGYDDWYLPARSELDQMHLAFLLGRIDFAPGSYLSSTEDNSPQFPWNANAKIFDFGQVTNPFINGFTFLANKNGNVPVRCVRRAN